MKALRIVSLLTLVFVFLSVVRCSDSKSDPVTLGTLSGTAFYPNSAGTNVAAPGAYITLLSGASTVQVVVADATGKFTFPELAAGEYALSGTYYAKPSHTGGRLDGLNFSTASDVTVTMTSADQAVDLNLVTVGQAGADLDIIDINYAWNGTSAFANTGAWTYDATHSPINFEFAYRGKEADFTGTFSQLNKVDINFDVANPATSSIDVSVDLMSFDTRSPGGRDPRTTVADSPLFSPITQFTEYGCIVNTVFGIATDDGVAPTDGAPKTVTTDVDRYATFVSSSIAKYGDGYIAKGNLVFHGFTVPIEMWFKQVPAWTDPSNNRRYTGFEGKFLMDAKNKWGITSSSLNDAIVRMQLSIVCYKQL
ncbi:MAG: YceI family protein [Cyclobacteriaceae bacterium]|nr:YceI family protein [Cyclobacteriaceae bacterium]